MADQGVNIQAIDDRLPKSRGCKRMETTSYWRTIWFVSTL